MLSIFVPRILDSLQVSYPIPELAINAIGAGVGGVLVLWGLFGDKKRGKELTAKTLLYAQQWEHYKKLTDLFISLKEVSGGQREEVLNNISRERVELDDSELQEWIGKFLNAEAECVKYRLKTDDYMIRRVLDMTRKRMNKRYKR